MTKIAKELIPSNQILIRKKAVFLLIHLELKVAKVDRLRILLVGVQTSGIVAKGLVSMRTLSVLLGREVIRLRIGMIREINRMLTK